MRILVIEHEHKVANGLRQVLEGQSYVADIAYDGNSGSHQIKSKPYDLIIADLRLPGKPGTTSLLRRLRTAGIHTPVLLLIPKDKVSDAPTAGADDFLVKPFTFSELIARVNALGPSRRQPVNNLLEYADLKLDCASFVVERAGKRILLTSREFALLEYLMRNAGKTVTKNNIINHVWNYESGIRPNTLEVYIGYLRSKIDEPFKGPKLIGTRRGFGYYLGQLQ